MTRRHNNHFDDHRIPPNTRVDAGSISGRNSNRGHPLYQVLAGFVSHEMGAHLGSRAESTTITKAVVVNRLSMFTGISKENIHKGLEQGFDDEALAAIIDRGVIIPNDINREYLVAANNQQRADFAASKAEGRIP